MPTVREDDFLADWLPRLQCGQEVVIPPGDDCAAIRQSDGSLLLVAADQVAASIVVAENHTVSDNRVPDGPDAGPLTSSPAAIIPQHPRRR